MTRCLTGGVALAACKPLQTYHFANIFPSWDVILLHCQTFSQCWRVARNITLSCVTNHNLHGHKSRGAVIAPLQHSVGGSSCCCQCWGLFQRVICPNVSLKFNYAVLSKMLKRKLDLTGSFLPCTVTPPPSPLPADIKVSVMLPQPDTFCGNVWTVWSLRQVQLWM